MTIKHFDQLIGQFRRLLAAMTDQRTGKNKTYSIEDIGLAAFAVFFTQSPSFLSHQKAMQDSKGANNAQTLFKIGQIPTDVHIRDMLDPVPPEHLFPVYDSVYEAFVAQGILDSFQGVHNTRLIALDGTWYFSSEKIDCPNCSHIEHQNGKVTNFHSAITPVIVAPGQPYAIPLRPEFIIPQDGHKKQDCEIVAGKRWLEKNGDFYQNGNATLLGDDIYAHQPFCKKALLFGYHFIFVCKPDSHKSLTDWVELLEPGHEMHTLKTRVKNQHNKWETYSYRYANAVPLAEADDTMHVHWCEVTVIDENGEQLYKNSFITDFEITDENVAEIVVSGRARWKIENENNNTLKTKGYNLEHNFGHGKLHLSSLLAAMNILAFLFHSYLTFCDEAYCMIRAHLPTRKILFEHVRALTCYI